MGIEFQGGKPGDFKCVMENGEAKTLSIGLQLAKVWGPILIFGIGVGIGWATLNNRITSLEARADTLEKNSGISQPKVEIIANQFPEMRQDISWLKANMYQILIKNGIQPVDPKTTTTTNYSPAK